MENRGVFRGHCRISARREKARSMALCAPQGVPGWSDGRRVEGGCLVDQRPPHPQVPGAAGQVIPDGATPLNFPLSGGADVSETLFDFALSLALNCGAVFVPARQLCAKRRFKQLAQRRVKRKVRLSPIGQRLAPLDRARGAFAGRPPASCRCLGHASARRCWASATR